MTNIASLDLAKHCRADVAKIIFTKRVESTKYWRSKYAETVVENVPFLYFHQQTLS